MSVGIHLLVASAFFGAVIVDEKVSAPLISYVQLAQPNATPTDIIQMPWADLSRGPSQGPPVAAPQQVAAIPTPVPSPTDDAVTPEENEDQIGEGESVILGDSVGEIAPSIGGRGSRGVLGPRFASGRLWVEPPRIVSITEALAALEQIESLDTLVAARILAFLDTVPRDSFAIAHAPSWTTEIDGQVFGIDDRWVHLGPIKIPTALLALLPVPQGNIEEARAYQRLQKMRESLLRQARSMQNRAEINEYIREMRERRDRERDTDRRRGRRRPVVAPRDTLVP